MLVSFRKPVIVNVRAVGRYEHEVSVIDDVQLIQESDDRDAPV